VRVQEFRVIHSRSHREPTDVPISVAPMSNVPSDEIVRTLASPAQKLMLVELVHDKAAVPMRCWAKTLAMSPCSLAAGQRNTQPRATVIPIGNSQTPLA